MKKKEWERIETEGNIKWGRERRREAVTKGE